MLLVTQTNLKTQGYKNIRELLLTNSNSVPVHSSYSDKAVIPDIILNVTPFLRSKRSNASDKYDIRVVISVYHTTRYKADTLAQELLNLLRANKDTFDIYQMELFDSNMTDSAIPISKTSRSHVSDITAVFTID